MSIAIIKICRLGSRQPTGTKPANRGNCSQVGLPPDTTGAVLSGAKQGNYS